MLDNVLPPDLLDDTLADIAPHKVPELIWSLIEPYFTRKYNVQVVDNYPDRDMVQTSITWTLVRRTPGREDSKIHGKGANFAKFLKVTPEGFVHEIYIQQQTIYYEYSVFATSTSVAEQIIWDLERAVLETVGILQSKMEGFQLVFDQQTLDTSMLWRQQDVLVRRTVRFQVLLPVKYTRLVQELRFIEIIENWSSLPITNQVFIRTSDDKNFYIPTSLGQRVINVSNVYLQSSTGWEPLELSRDYSLKKNTDQTIFLEWQDEYGKTPLVGNQFRIDYEIAQFVAGRTLNKSK